MLRSHFRSVRQIKSISPKFLPRNFRSKFSTSRITRTGTQTFGDVRPRRWWPKILTLSIVVGAFATWKIMTWHEYPQEVAGKLKEGLMAEINGAGFRRPDHKKALHCYIEALLEADKLEMSPLSDEYTGIQLKIADMYEQLGMVNDAVLMYLEIGDAYLSGLALNQIPEALRGHIISRNLKVALMAGIYLSSDPQTAWRILMPHLQLASREAARNSDVLAEAMKDQSLFNFDYLDGLKTGALPNDKLEKSWAPFRDDIFSLREMMVGLYVASGESIPALLYKLKTTKLMVESGFPVGDCMLSVVNAASLLYYQGIMAYARVKSDDNSKIEKTNLSLFQPLSLFGLDGGPHTPEKFMDLSKLAYSKIKESVEGLNGSDRRSAFVPEAYAMALYGLGVIHVSRREWAEAADIFEEVRLRARGCEVEDLIRSAESEMAKVDKLKNRPSDENDDIPLSELPDLSIMFWRLDPENFSKGDRPHGSH